MTDPKMAPENENFEDNLRKVYDWCVKVEKSLPRDYEDEEDLDDELGVATAFVQSFIEYLASSRIEDPEVRSEVAPFVRSLMTLVLQSSKKYGHLQSSKYKYVQLFSKEFTEILTSLKFDPYPVVYDREFITEMVGDQRSRVIFRAGFELGLQVGGANPRNGPTYSPRDSEYIPTTTKWVDHMNNAAIVLGSSPVDPKFLDDAKKAQLVRAELAGYGKRLRKKKKVPTHSAAPPDEDWEV